jgi:HEAT repeat protein
VQRLADPVPDVSAAAQEALMAMEQAIDWRADRFARLLRAPRPHVRANAVRCIPRVRFEPNMGWSAYVRALDDPSFEVRQAAAQTLRQWYSRLPTEVMTRLQSMLKRPESPHDRIEAAHAVAQYADDKREAVAALIVGLESPDGPTRISASWALYCVAPFASQALPALIRAARRDPDPNVRSRALWALGKMGPKAKTAVPALERLGRDPVEHIRRFAKEAIARIGTVPARAVRRLARAASRRPPGRRR